MKRLTVFNDLGIMISQTKFDVLELRNDSNSFKTFDDAQVSGRCSSTSSAKICALSLVRDPRRHK